MRHIAQRLFPGAVFFGILFLVWLAYQRAVTGVFLFDDWHNLANLSQVQDLRSALDYIFSGAAGPLGRPISLATLTAQHYAWPHHPETFLATNILIHTLNGALVFWIFLWFNRIRGATESTQIWPALTAAALWLTLPLLASSSLFVVQRMTTLATTGVLLGLLGYLWSRSHLEHKGFFALAGMGLSLLVGTLLAAHAKENGALLPILVLVTELTIFRSTLFTKSRIHLVWGIAFLAAPTVMLLAYLFYSVPYSENIVLVREFTSSQRLLTQTSILWEYLLHAFIPTPKGLVPFRDEISAVEGFSDPKTIFATALWVAAIYTAMRLRVRTMLPAFAVFWYLGAHLLESTVLSLELYFQHRNYLALIGPSYAIAMGAWSIKGIMARSVRIGMFLYIGALYISLTSTTSLWGTPHLAAEIWAIYNPQSIRTNQGLARRLAEQDFQRAAVRVLDGLVAENPVSRAPVGIQALILSCAIAPDADHSLRTGALLQNLPHSKHFHGVPDALNDILDFSRSAPCASVTPDLVQELALALATNKRYLASPVSAHNLYVLLGSMAIEKRDFEKTMVYYEAALHAAPTIQTLFVALELLLSAGRPDLAPALFDVVRDSPPKNPIQRKIWVNEITSLESQMQEDSRHNPGDSVRN